MSEIEDGDNEEDYVGLWDVARDGADGTIGFSAAFSRLFRADYFGDLVLDVRRVNFADRALVIAGYGDGANGLECNFDLIAWDILLENRAMTRRPMPSIPEG